MSQGDQHEIKAPHKQPLRTAARGIVEAVVESVPFGGVATAIGQALVPTGEAKDRDRWAGELTDRVNEHDRALRNSVTISGVTATVALWMANTSTDGWREPTLFLDDLVAALGSEHPAAQVKDAVGELQYYGLLDVQPCDLIAPTNRLFLEIDQYAKGWNVREDAKRLAALALCEHESVSAHELEHSSGFERRRFNPALAYLLTMFDQDGIIAELQPDYPATGAALSLATRARLRAFLAGK